MSKESYIAGFTKAAESHGVDPGMLVKIAQDMFADNYFRYDPAKIDDIFLSLNPELEQNLLETAERTGVTSIKPSGSSGHWRDYSPKPVSTATKPVSTATAPKEVKIPRRVSGLDRIPLAVKRLMPVIKKSLPRLVKTVR